MQGRFPDPLHSHKGMVDIRVNRVRFKGILQLLRIGFYWIVRRKFPLAGYYIYNVSKQRWQGPCDSKEQTYYTGTTKRTWNVRFFLNAPPGAKVALITRSGMGAKTTKVALIQYVLPQAGWYNFHRHGDEVSIRGPHDFPTPSTDWDEYKAPIIAVEFYWFKPKKFRPRRKN